MEYHENYVVD